MSKAAAEKALEQFNDGDWESVEPFFHTFENFFKFLSKYGLDEELNFSNIPEDFENQYLAVMLQSNPDKTLEYITNNLVTDVNKRDDGYYLYLRDREELSELFYESSRREGSRYVAKAVLGEDWWEPYYDTVNDVYDDVYDELTPENREIVIDAINDELKDSHISPETEELEIIAEEQGHPDYVILSIEILRELMNDRETAKHILNEASEVESNLSSLHNSAYNTAYTDEIYEDVWGELATFFEGRIEDIPRQVKKNDGTEVTRYDSYIKIKGFDDIIKDYLNEYPENNYSTDSLGYYGSFVTLLKEMMDNEIIEWLDFRVPDYPDFRKVTEYINDGLRDYL